MSVEILGPATTGGLTTRALSSTRGRRGAHVTLAVAALSVAALVLVGPGTSSVPAAASTPSACSIDSTFPWASTMGSGTAGTVYYVLEISNIGSTTCTLRGYARVWAVSQGGARIGQPASRASAPIAAPLVTLSPDATAHLILGVVDTGALCGTSSVESMGLRVVPPGQNLPKSPGERDELVVFPLEVCKNESSMRVGPLHAGAGIPLYTNL